MNCQQTRDMLGKYLDGELEVNVSRAVDAHLACCAHCREELQSLQNLVGKLEEDPDADLPAHLWPAIESSLPPAKPLEDRSSWVRRIRRPSTIAASIILIAGLALVSVLWSNASRAQAANIDFSLLLDALSFDTSNAFQKFLTRYSGHEIAPARAKQYAPALNFEVPEDLPHGFHLERVYGLRFGAHPGVACRYVSRDDVLIAIFHRPIQREDFGTHRDHDCLVGKHHGHKVEVGQWKMVHLTDPTTCHCVLSRLNEQTQLPQIMQALAPRFQCNCGCRSPS